ncbi:uncharacterized protein LOC123681997 [Harmonia axyridis]|uniref:uncharacterized protein LOC123681997 n=1 Tax=Harmonia axyridis TaxID=115357 RepID=UPI001E2750AC|nr:uncharacterized protein LOC123681997 [Harmonia axyridis]
MHKIICKNVPEALLNREAAKIHFRKFGSAKRIAFRTASRIITVEYGGEEAVEKVLQYGNVYDNKTFSISRESTSAKEKSRNRKIKSVKDVMNIPDDVQAELDAMGGGPSLALVGKSVSRREVLSNDTPKKGLKRRGTVDKEKVTPKKNRSLALFMNDEYQQLLEIINQRAITIEEKYKVLDARDKILRILQKKKGANSGPTKGTCPDMCPEKERLLRVIQHQVSSFEHNSNKEMDPNLAVKQYSRSSADQESPLPHELRPVDSLLNTMAYLIHDVYPIGDRSNVNFGEWYHFIWDRTRAIRKDITQQELCCTQTVEMIEQCARFHIHCSARLVAEEPSVFDQKINTENLTKCLQTLKYMYHDLRLQNILCPNEAEFRGYIILLNLNDDNFMAEVQRLPKEIQESKEVKTAMKFHSVLNETNFVRFFKLVRETTYLNACILMRYFMQIRCHALNMIIKCYTPRHANVTYPVSTLTENLGFESDNHTIKYLEECNLVVDQSKMQVILDKYSYSSPSFNYTSQDRSINLVESKKGDETLDCVIFGGPIPPYIPLKATSSFNDEGYLIDFLQYNIQFDDDDLNEPVPEKQAVLLKTCIPEESSEAMCCESEEPVAQEEKDDELLSQAAGVSPLEGQLTDTENRTHDDIRDLLNVDDNDTVESNMKENASKFKDTDTFVAKSNSVPYDYLLKSFPLDRMDETPDRSIFPTFKICDHDIKIRASCEDSWRNLVQNNALSLSNLVKDNIEYWSKATDILGGTSSSVEMDATDTRENNDCSFSRIVSPPQKKSNLLAKTPKTSPDESKLEEEGRELARNIISKIIDEEVAREAHEALELSRSKREKVTKAVDVWRRYVIKKKQERSLTGWCTGMSYSGNLRRIAQDYSLKLQEIPQVRLIPRPFVLDFSLWDRPSVKLDLHPFADILTKRYQSLRVKKTNNVASSIYWKCIISQPDLNHAPARSLYVKQSLENYINWKDIRTPFIKQICSKNSIVRCCISREIGCGDLTNDASGILFIADSMNAELNRRITEKFVNTGIYVCIPIVVILGGDCESDHQLQGLVRQGIISEFKIFTNYTRHGLVNTVKQGLEYLASTTTGPPPIVVDYLATVIFKNYFTSEIWQKVISSTQSNDSFRRCFCNPNVVFNLFNEGLQRLKRVILDESCYEYGRFPKEFRQFEEFLELPNDYKHLPEQQCHDEEYKNSIEELFDNELSVRPFPNWPPSNETELDQLLWNFSCLNSANDPSEFYRKLLNKLREILDDDVSQLGNFMWTEVLDLIFTERYSNFQKCFINQLPIVVYHTATLEDFLSMKWINVTNPIIKSVIDYQVDSNTSKQTDVSISEIDEVMARANRLLKYNKDCNIVLNFSEFYQNMNDVSTSLLVTQNITSKFTQYFKKTMEDD